MLKVITTGMIPTAPSQENRLDTIKLIELGMVEKKYSGRSVSEESGVARNTYKIQLLVIFVIACK